MHDFLMWAGGLIVSGLFALIGWLIKLIFGRIDKNAQRIEQLDEKIDEHKLYAAETFTTKYDIKSMRDELISHLNRIEDKLDKKADK